MRYAWTASIAGLSLFCAGAFAQSPALSIANYQFVSDQVITGTQSRVTYRVDLVNSGPALGHVTANVMSVDPFAARVIPGQDTLNFDNVPANGKVTSSDTFTVLISTGTVVSPSALQWTFQTTGGPVANAGPNQTAALGSTVTLNGSGSTNPSGAGNLAYHWAFTSLPQGSSAFLANSYSPFSTFVADVAGTYVIALTVSNGAESSTASVTVSTSRTAPVANAGPNQTVAVGATAVLNGSASTSADGRTLTYAWTLIMRPAGSAASLSGASTVSPTFVVDLAGTYIAQLVVNDGMPSSPATVTITTQAVKPAANAGPNQSVNVGALVQLNGAGSTDSGGHSLTYQWSWVSLPSGSTASLNNPAAVNPTFTADKAGTYVAQLTVSNGTLASTPATVTITTQAQLPPSANAGSNQTVNIGSTVPLNGSGNDPQGLPLTYQWSLIGKPALSVASLSGANGQHPTFFADVAGSYVAQLIVNNGVLNSAPATVTISTSCVQPTANAGPSQNVTTGAFVTLNGSGSTGACQGPMTYAWSLTSRPGGSAATLSASTTVSPSFVADVAGAYVAQLIVNNGVTASNPATVTITASGGGTPPSGGSGLTLPSNLTVSPGQTVPYSVTVGAPASDWLFVTLSSSNPSVVTIFPSGMLIPAGAMAPARAPTITGLANGSATITAVIDGMGSASGTVQVGSGGSGGGGATSMSFSPASLTFNSLGTQNLTLTLNAPAPSGGLTVNLSSSNTGVATVPASVSFGSNATSVQVPVSAKGPGSATITASASGVSNASAAVTVNIATAQPSINVSSSVTVTSGQSVAFPVTLSAPAPAGGLFVMLTSSDLSKATVTTSVIIGGGATSPAQQPVVSGVSAGSATITATASGYTAGSGAVQVQAAVGGGGGGGGQTFFLPGNVNLNQGTTQTIELLLSTPSPVPLTATLTSSNTSIFTVPSTLAIPAGSGGVNLVVTAGSPGSATLTAVTPGYGTTSVNVTVLPTGGVSVTWYGACWQTATIFGIHGNFQAMDLAISTPAPVTLNATLFFAPNCDPSQGTDNMNDFGSTMGSGHTVQGFSHFPDVMPVSAMYWIGLRTADGKCPPGAPCSGCVNYTKTTPNCDLLP